MRWLERKKADPATIAEEQRHTKVIDRLVELKAETAARAVTILLPAGTATTGVPAGVSFHPGLLTISFGSPEQLVERLFR